MSIQNPIELVNGILDEVAQYGTQGNIYAMRWAAKLLQDAGFNDDDIEVNLVPAIRGYYWDRKNHPNMDPAQTIAYTAAENIVEHYTALMEEQKHNKETIWKNIHDQNGIK